MEVSLATTEHVLQTLSTVDKHLTLLTAASRADEIVRVVGDYLASWSPARVENLQKSDGGWGAFDLQGRPEPICDMENITRISNVLSSQCRALKDAGIEPTLELLELDLYFAVAKQMAEPFLASRARLRTRTFPRTGFHRWSDGGAKAA